MMKKIKTTEIGRIGEDEAVRFLKKQGFKILGRNVHISHNEIDVIALLKKQKIIAFVEVKTRSVDEKLYSAYGTPATAVTKDKQQRTLIAAKSYLRENSKFYDYQPRFDVFEVYLDKENMRILKTNYIENAFGV